MPTTKKTKKIAFPSEFRYDLISKDWVIIAARRAKRPETFKKQKREKQESSRDKCPFCHPETQEAPTLVLVNGKKFTEKEIPKNWTTIVVPNKYPAVIPYPKLEEKIEGGIYKKINAVGFHEVVITRDHKKPLGKFEIKEIKELIDAYQQRYLCLMKEKFVNYISIFQNYGAEAGASVFHPHSQIITTPLVDVDLNRALENSQKYFQKTKKCVYCQMLEWERKTKKRIVFENKEFLVICPFAPKVAFEIIISPKKHLSNFEKIGESEKWQLAEAFQAAMSKLYKGLNNPAYNFYLHTVPCDGKEYPQYHWHWTVLPKTANWAGFEIGTKMEISTIEPEKAAEYLRKQ
jgi:UDPglucose--hexose-1-phosphate uridylyltransferase